MHTLVEAFIYASNNFAFGMAITRKPKYVPQFLTKE